MMNRVNYLGLLPIMIIAFALRLIFLDHQSLWYDESVTWLLTQMSLPQLIEWTAADIQPPFYYLLLWNSEKVFGSTEWALRFPSVFCNLLTIPILYRLSQRLKMSQRASLLATLLFALSPLMIYYSQEARMYTLLILETTLASYLLLKNLSLMKKSSAVFYALVAASALYTHYFAAFLLIAHLLYTIVILWQQRWSSAIRKQAFQMFGLTTLFFLPWLPILFARLGDDPSYWAGPLKINEAIRKIFISFIAGETMLEEHGVWVATIFLLLLSAAALFLYLDSSQHDSNSNSFFLMLWLWLPLLLILALAFQSPKFNPRYTILVWPAFILLISHLIAALSTRSHLRRPFASLIILFILSIFGLSLYNWFFDPRFRKDDFKAVAQFVQEREKKSDTILLSSGHMFPVWAYYYGWENWTSLPKMARLDVNQITSLKIAPELEQALAEKKGVWLITWQDEVIDPNQIIPFWLDRIGQRSDETYAFWGVGLQYWKIKPTQTELLQTDPIDHPLNFNFADKIHLIGMTQSDNDELVLFWQARQPLPENLILTLQLTDSEELIWSPQKLIIPLGAETYPPSRWSPGETIITRHPLQWRTGTPPGLYIAEIGLGVSSDADFKGWDILDEQGRPARRTALLEPINRSQLARPEQTAPLTSDPLVDFFPIIGLRRSLLASDKAEAGDQILLSLWWQAGPFNLDDISLAFDLIDAEEQIFRVGSSLTPSRNFNLPRWKPHDIVLGQYWLDIPPDAAPGPAILQLHLLHQGAFSYDEIFSFDTLEILPTDRNFTPPDSFDIPLEANFSDQITLLGADCQPDCHLTPGESITLTFYWRSETPVDTNYTIFTHLLDPKNEMPLLNADHAPPKPIRGWIKNEIISDSVTLNLPPDFPSPPYLIEVGLYDANDPTFPRLPLANGETRVILPGFQK